VDILVRSEAASNPAVGGKPGASGEASGSFADSRICRWARSVLTPQLTSIYDTSSLANLEIDDPAWVAQIRQEIVRLEGGREPAAPGQRDMSVQPPQ